MQDQDPIGHQRREQQLLDRFAFENLDARSYNRWAAVRSSHRFMAHLSKRIIAFRVSGNIPVTLNTFECKELRASFGGGFQSTWTVKGSGMPGQVVLGHVPVEVADGCFMGHTIVTGAEFVEYAPTQFGLLASMYYKTPANPIRDLRQGPVYLIEEPAFHRLFPG